MELCQPTAALVSYRGLGTRPFDWANFENIVQRHRFNVPGDMESHQNADFAGSAYLEGADAKTTIPLTLVALFSVSPNTQPHSIVSLSNATNDQSYFTAVIRGGGTGYGRAILKVGASTAISEITTDFADGSTHFIAATADSSDVQVTVDATTGTAASHSLTPAGDWSVTTIGALNTGSGVSVADGVIGQAAAFGVVLTSAQIAWLRNSGNGRTYDELVSSGDADNPGTTNLLGWWPLAEGSGASRTDSHSSGITLAEQSGNVADINALQSGNEPAVVDGKVITSTNLGTNSSDASQATFAARPYYRDSAGEQFIEFDGSDDLLDAGVITPSSQPNTVFLVVRPRTTGADQALCDTPSAANQHLIGVENTGPEMAIEAGTRQTIALTPGFTEVAVWCAVFNGASSKLWKNGGTGVAVSGSLGTESWGGMRLGADASGAQFADCDVFYYVANDGELSLSEINEIGGQLASLFGTTWSTAT